MGYISNGMWWIVEIRQGDSSQRQRMVGAGEAAGFFGFWVRSTYSLGVKDKNESKII